MLQKNNLQRELSQKTAMSLGFGMALWLTLLIFDSKIVSGQTGDATYDVAFGPLVLNTITRHEQSHGFTVALSFENGLIWYVILWLAVGLTFGFIRWRTHSPTA